MKVNLYAIFDSASGVYDGPFPSLADEAAIRDFTNVARNTETKVGRNPEYFTLFKVGTWNDGTSELVDINATKLINGVEALAPVEKEIN